MSRDDQAPPVIARERSDRSNPFKKADSSMDRHADKSARDDNKKVDSRFASEVQNLTTHKGGRIEKPKRNNSTQVARRKDLR